MRVFELNAWEVAAYSLKMRAGDRVYLSGQIYTARDAAHRRLMADLDAGSEPFPLRGSIIYYTGPCPGVVGRPIISAGPTTSGRMDTFTPRLYSLGVAATIGKGQRNALVKDALCQYSGVYFAATGGAGALLAQCITHNEVVSYPELGPEAVLLLTVERMPLIVADDALGNSIYK